ncbi:uncharacterized protein LAJ45_11064 [Morchella importuna]|uniref:uncharacterized protein n=1 Tax=Morchella importuna TaxID=1174673 RepID=UPI001E8CFD87|nr:uncharacterized protein LAJ45_11064 [Morchella importuna]KAH8144943.1 hypothetical protein LAJ45_11064 [Morchella importuna]
MEQSSHTNREASSPHPQSLKTESPLSSTIPKTETPYPFITFTSVPVPPVAFSFPLPPIITARAPYSWSGLTPSSTYPRKRARPLADVDGIDKDCRDYNKKRRLRLKLITSRLSEPFAIPPTNILDRGNCSRVALWAKTRAVSRHVLRKAAILNKIKRDAMAARAAQERQVEIARQQYREKLAANAKSNTKRNRVAQSNSPIVQGSHVMKTPRKPKDPYGIPKHHRPPTPPSETELEYRRRGMGLGI